MASSRHAAPMVVGGAAGPLRLQRVELGGSSADLGHREAFLQDLVHQHPELIPITQIEPAYAPLISACCEMPTPAGYIDNVWITPAGGIVLGECKLVRNPQARREVVAQALDYVRAIADWDYERLEEAVRTATKQPSLTLWKLVEPNAELSEAEFVDAVQRRLKLSRILVLIIGDGIQEGVEALTAHLQMHAGIHAGLALVDLSIWELPSKELLVVPRVPMRTEVIVRGIVTVEPNTGVIVMEPSSLALKKSKPQSLSEAEFYDALQERTGVEPSRLRAFLATLEPVGVKPEFKRSLVLRFSPSAESTGSAGYVDRGGTVWLGDAMGAANRAGKPDVGRTYMNRLATAIGGKVREYPNAAPALIGPDGKTASVETLLNHSAAWRQGISELCASLADPS